MRLHFLFFAATLLIGVVLAPRPLRAQDSSDEPSRDEFVDVDVEPTPIKDLARLIEYPYDARVIGLEGRVDLSLLIAKDGSVKKVALDGSSGHRFDSSAINAAMLMKFTPAVLHGKTTMVWWTVPIVFRLLPGSEMGGEAYLQSHPDVADVNEGRVAFLGLDSAPALISDPRDTLEYPASAIKQKLEGRVIFSVIIDEAGNVVIDHIVHETDRLFIASASHFVSKMHFLPATKFKMPTSVCWFIAVDFKLVGRK